MARIAKSLAVFRSEVDQRAPGRNKRSDGWIGNPAHAATASDHNPNSAGVVCAFDLTHDPANGVDIHALFDWLVAHPPAALKYVIAGRRIASRKTGFVPRPYHGGTDPSHDGHLHASAGVGPDGQSSGPYDDTTSWLQGFGQTAPLPAPPQIDPKKVEEAMLAPVVRQDGTIQLFVVGRDSAVWTIAEKSPGVWPDKADGTKDWQSLGGEVRKAS